MAAVSETSPLLAVHDVSLGFGGVKVLQDVSFDVPLNSIVALIGPNGAGKSSLFNVITGVYRAQSGSVVLADSTGGVELLATRPHRLAVAGVARTFQNLQLVPGFTALENVLVGRHPIMTSGTARSLLWWGPARAEDRRHRQVCLETLDFFGLAKYAGTVVATLPYGVQKKIEIARALATRPRLLLLDEPAAGLNDDESAEIAAIMRLIRDSGTCTQVLVEHDMSIVMSTASQIVVLNHGSVLAAGTTDEVRRHPDVISAYLGTGGESQGSAPRVG